MFGSGFSDGQRDEFYSASDDVIGETVEVLCDVSFSLDKMKNIVEKTGGCFVWGGAVNLAPADDKIIKTIAKTKFPIPRTAGQCQKNYSDWISNPFIVQLCKVPHTIQSATKGTFDLNNPNNEIKEISKLLSRKINLYLLGRVLVLVIGRLR